MFPARGPEPEQIEQNIYFLEFYDFSKKNNEKSINQSFETKYASYVGWRMEQILVHVCPALPPKSQCGISSLPVGEQIPTTYF